MRSVALKTTTTGLSFPRCHEKQRSYTAVTPAIKVNEDLSGQGGGGGGGVCCYSDLVCMWGSGCMWSQGCRGLTASYFAIVLGGSWVVINGVISRVTILVTHTRDL